jgi:hypothetical protein
MGDLFVGSLSTQQAYAFNLTRVVVPLLSSGTPVEARGTESGRWISSAHPTQVDVQDRALTYWLDRTDDPGRGVHVGGAHARSPEEGHLETDHAPFSAAQYAGVSPVEYKAGIRF